MFKYYYSYAGSKISIYSVEEHQGYGNTEYTVTRYFTSNEDTKKIEWNYEKNTRYNRPPIRWQIIDQYYIVKMVFR